MDLPAKKLHLDPINLDLHAIPPPPLSSRVAVVAEPPQKADLSGWADALQKRIAELTGRIALLDHELDEKMRRHEQYNRDLAVTSLELEQRDDALKNIEIQIAKFRSGLAQHSAEIVTKMARSQTLSEEIDLLDRSVAEKREQVRFTIAQETNVLNGEIERLTKFKRQAKDEIQREIQAAKEASLIEVQAFKAEALRFAQEDLERVEQEQVIVKAGLKREIDAALEDAKAVSHALIKEAEEWALATRFQAEKRSGALFLEAQNVVAEAQADADKVRAEARKRQHEMENEFLHANAVAASEVKATAKAARQTAEQVIHTAQVQGAEELRRAHILAEEIIESANKRARQIVKDADRIGWDLVEKEKMDFEAKKHEHSLEVEQAHLQAADLAQATIEKAKREAERIFLNAKEQAAVISHTADIESQEKLSRIDEIVQKRLKDATRKGDSILSEAATTAAFMIEKSKTRAENIDKTVAGFISTAEYEAGIIIRAATDSKANLDTQTAQGAKRLKELHHEIKILEDRVQVQQMHAEDEAVAKAAWERTRRLPRQILIISVAVIVTLGLVFIAFIKTQR